jgi:hypothetical protein
MSTKQLMTFILSADKYIYPLIEIKETCGFSLKGGILREPTVPLIGSLYFICFFIKISIKTYLFYYLGEGVC